jgi:hypothetical protein
MRTRPHPCDEEPPKENGETWCQNKRGIRPPVLFDKDPRLTILLKARVFVSEFSTTCT